MVEIGEQRLKLRIRPSQLLFILALMFSPVIVAQQLLTEIAELSPMHQARVLEQDSTPDIEKIYPLGSIRRISGNLRFTDEVLVRGSQQRLTLQLAPTQSAMDAFTAVRQELHDSDAQIIYWCEGRECGPSNLWANSVLFNSRLYGPDERQAYSVFRLQQQSELVVVYAVTRGNGRGMLHLEHFRADKLPTALLPQPSTLLRLLREDTAVQLSQAPLEPDAQWLDMLQRMLNLDRSLHFTIGGINAKAWHEKINNARLQLASDQQPKLTLKLLP